MSRYSQKHKDFAEDKKITIPPRRLEGDGRAYDLTSPLIESAHVRVTCSLASDGIIWGKYKENDAAVMHLLFNANEPPGYKLKHFKLDLSLGTIEPPTSGIPQVYLLHEMQPVPLPGVAPQYIEGRPWTKKETQGPTIGPKVDAGGVGVEIASWFRTTEMSKEYRWIFRGKASPDHKTNVMTNASWIWESNKENPQVEDRGYLHGGLAFRHGGGALRLICDVEGKLCKDSRWYRFGKPDRAEQKVWEKPTVLSTYSIKKHVENLELVMLARNQVAVARKSSISSYAFDR